MSEDRKNQGVLLKMSIRWNITLPILRKLSKFIFISQKEENACVNKYKDALRIKTPSVNQLVGNLSGGNQQKVAVAKWLASESKILILDEPTRGIDVGAKQEIYELINQLTQEGLGIIMISSEMEEIMGMSDRMLVMAEGNVVGELQKEEFSQDKILRYASNITT
ncbi:Ribose import ATP-binding protein RbsA [bioreactor metagenome]|uniref:Ribose import ATP-binding protein RbsA n=1 Tax=bioreactor metagenome TaxID=1076179 RepID=A0A645I6M8_9ZZZZ